MSESTVAIVGSGIVGAAIAYHLTERGHDVVIFEKGPEFPYPHEPQFKEQVLYLRTDNPKWVLPKDLKGVEVTGDYGTFHHDLDGELGMVVGGSATHWGGVAVRMHPNDFKLKSKYGYAEDWPITYQDLEPYYGRAEAMIGVSGTDEDNPFAPPRSTPFALPPFDLSWDDRLLAERLKKDGIIIHTTPQARTRLAYDDRPGCMNFGVCATCPIGVRYSPSHHLNKAIATGRCTIRSNVSARRLLLDDGGRARAIVVRSNDGGKDEEHAAKVIVVAAGAIESARLLLLSRDSRAPDGVGNASGHVGRHLVFHHYYTTRLRFSEALFPGRLGPPTGQTMQFVDPETRGRHGGIKVDFHSWPSLPNPWERFSGEEILRDFEVMKHSRPLGLHAESVPSDQKYVGLAERTDRFGDRFAHVQYQSCEFDYETHRFGRTIFDRFVRASGATDAAFEDDPSHYSSGAHHMGTCRMATDAANGVVDPFCRVFGSTNLFVVGGGSFVGGSGAVHPTLTMVALAIRVSDYILGRLI